MRYRNIRYRQLVIQLFDFLRKVGWLRDKAAQEKWLRPKEKLKQALDWRPFHNLSRFI